MTVGPANFPSRLIDHGAIAPWSARACRREGVRQPVRKGRSTPLDTHTDRVALEGRMSEQIDQLARKVAEHVVAALAPYLPAQSRRPGYGSEVYGCRLRVGAAPEGLAPFVLPHCAAPA